MGVRRRVKEKKDEWEASGFWKDSTPSHIGWAASTGKMIWIGMVELVEL